MNEWITNSSTRHGRTTRYPGEHYIGISNVTEKTADLESALRRAIAMTDAGNPAFLEIIHYFFP